MNKFMDIKLLEIFNNSVNICKTYELLDTLILNNYMSSSQYRDCLNDLYHYLDIEKSIYKNLSIDELNKYISILSEVIDNDNLINEIERLRTVYDALNRVMRYLTEKRDLLSGNVNMVDFSYKKLNISGSFIAEDIIESYIIIESYKLIFKKIISTGVTSTRELKFRNDLIKLYHRSKINELSSFELNELFGRACSFDIETLPSFDISSIFNYDNLGDDGIKSYVTRVIRLLDSVDNFTDDDKSLEDVFELLVILCDIEVLLSILDVNSLEEIIDYSEALFNDDNEETLASGSVKRLIRKKEEELDN